MLIIPYEVDVPFERTPFVNWLLVGSIVLVFAFQLAVVFDVTEGTFDDWVLDGFTLKGIFGHMWLHGGIFHVIGNLIFLWVFGNAVCQKMGNLLYLPVYLFVGAFAAITHVLFDGDPAIGASGAINGLVAIYLMFFPVHDITCLWYFFYRGGTFTVSGFWIILMWLAFDILGAARGDGGVAYFAHLGGFAAGIGVGLGLLVTKLVSVDEHDDTILDIIRRGRNKTGDSESGRVYSDYEIRQMIDKKKYGCLDEGVAEQTSELPTISPAEVLERRINPPIAEKKPDDPIRFYCDCGQRIKMPVKYAGRTGKCPGCSNRIVIPSA